ERIARRQGEGIQEDLARVRAGDEPPGTAFQACHVVGLSSSGGPCSSSSPHSPSSSTRYCFLGSPQTTVSDSRALVRPDATAGRLSKRCATAGGGFRGRER